MDGRTDGQTNERMDHDDELAWMDLGFVWVQWVEKFVGRFRVGLRSLVGDRGKLVGWWAGCKVKAGKGGQSMRNYYGC